MFLITFRKVDEYRNCLQHSKNILAINGSACGWWEWIRPITLAGLIADFLRVFGQLVRRIASINDTFDVLFSSVPIVKFGRQLTHYSVAERILNLGNFPPNVTRIETLLYNDMPVIRRVVVDLEYSRELMGEDHVYGCYYESREEARGTG